MCIKDIEEEGEEEIYLVLWRRRCTLWFHKVRGINSNLLSCLQEWKIKTKYCNRFWKLCKV